MNFFEQELRRIAEACVGVISPTFAGRACYGDLGGDNRVKLQFVIQGTTNKYEALEATVLNRENGKVDCLIFRFADTWGKKQVGNPNFKDGILPYIWTYQRDSEWYVYRPTDTDIKKLAAEVSAYLDVFTDRSIVPEKTKGKAGEKDSVMKEIRESKPKTTTRKTAQARKKTEPDL